MTSTKPQSGGSEGGSLLVVSHVSQNAVAPRCPRNTSWRETLLFMKSAGTIKASACQRFNWTRSSVKFKGF